jgi:hypothetical protein
MASSEEYSFTLDPALAAAAASSPVPQGPATSSRLRFATQRPLEALGLAKNGNLRLGRVGGLGGLLTLFAAAQELNDSTESGGRNLAQATGLVAGGLGGGVLGGAAAGFLGGGPIGALAGAAAGGFFGGEAGRALGGAGFGLVEGSPNDQALRQAEKMGRAQLALEVERARALAPLQEAAAQAALANEAQRAEVMAKLQNDQLLRQTMAQALLQQSQAAGQQQLATTAALFGGLV